MFLLYSLRPGAPIWPIGVGGPRVCPVRAHSSYATGVEKAEAEIKKFDGRLGSLIDEKNSLSRKVRYLEEANKLLQDHVESLQHKVNQVPSVQIVNVTKDQDTVRGG